jgi:starch synthase
MAKVLGVVIAHPLRKFGGAMTAAFELSRSIAKVAPYELAVMWDEDKTELGNGLKTLKFRCHNSLDPVLPMLPRWSYIPFYLSRIPEHIEEGEYDLVHIHNPIPTFAMKKVAEACIRKGIPYCITTHGFMEVLNYSKISGYGLVKSALANLGITRPFLWVVKNAAWIFTLSPNDNELLNKIGYPLAQTSCVSNGVKACYLQSPDETEKMQLREKLDLTKDANIKLLFAGSLHPYKGVDTFLASLHHLPDPVTAIVGGSFKSDREKEELLQKVEASSLTRHKIVFTGWLTDEELRSLYHLADIFVYPTQGDTLPLSVLEAMASGLPVVSTKVGGIPFQLAENSGFLVKPNDTEAIAKIVRRLMENADLRKTTGDNARRRVEEIFNWAKAAKITMDDYQKIIDLYKASSNNRVCDQAKKAN